MSLIDKPCVPICLFISVLVLFLSCGITVTISHFSRTAGVETYAGNLLHFSNCTSQCGPVTAGAAPQICYTSLIGDVMWNDSTTIRTQDDVGGLFPASTRYYAAACDSVPKNVTIVTSYGYAVGIREKDFVFVYVTYEEAIYGFLFLAGSLFVIVLMLTVYLYECYKRRRVYAPV